MKIILNSLILVALVAGCSSSQKGYKYSNVVAPVIVGDNAFNVKVRCDKDRYCFFYVSDISSYGKKDALIRYRGVPVSFYVSSKSSSGEIIKIKFQDGIYTSVDEFDYIAI